MCYPFCVPYTAGATLGSRLHLVLLTLGGLWWGGFSVQPAVAADPILTCTVHGSLNQAGTGAESTPWEVSNIQIVKLSVVLNANGNNNVVPLSPPMVNPDPVGSQNPALTVQVFDATTGALLPVRTTVTGGAGNGNGLSIVAQVPEDPPTRQSRIQNYLTRIVNQEQASGSATQQDLDAVEQKHGAILTALDQDIVQNRVGKLRIVCTYASTAPGTWGGQVDSPPVWINVLDQGDFLSQPQFGLQGP